MQRKSSARQKAVTDPQRSAAAQPVPRAVRELNVPPPSSVRRSGEATLGGHVDRGLTLAALYDTGVLERLRLEVRVRLISDLTQSLAWLHANPRLMAAHPHLVVAPSTILIGLDGVARVDVRAAKKQESERNPLESDYIAPEITSGDSTADLRADVFSLGVLTWEALAGKRISAPDAWAAAALPIGANDAPTSELPAALGREREPLRRRAPARFAPKPSHGHLHVTPPLTLPEGGEWATTLAELALMAMCPEPSERPQDCRLILQELELLASRLATTQEIAEVVQGISAVQTLCIPEPTLPDASEACQLESSGGLGFMDRQPCAMLTANCAQRPLPIARRVAPPEPAPARASNVALTAVPLEPQPPQSKTVQRLRELSTGSSGRVWFVAGLFWLAVLGSLAGYAASHLGMR
jgi:Protein tyrosine and serine/threonine kinase